ncbi:KxYKxGKxW signal peptide domain-containing protein [Secundilactobacillus yichangensis]|uniref:KxYKxGKxW signal peptide domain-containing protein n=1 Tax=Secundilactobacillus yichangensis TaxID=2799580 RepID=UPI00194041E7|nr:KxYKxGKxW signal peptide domain-containing protein [Secundilactobacillus yichangensis]
MTKRRKMLLNKVTTERREHYKMYKNGSAWAFTCIVLIAGVFWTVPVVSAHAAATPTPTNQVVNDSNTLQSAGDDSTSNATTATSVNQAPTTGTAAVNQVA